MMRLLTGLLIPRSAEQDHLKLEKVAERSAGAADEGDAVKREEDRGDGSVEE